MRNAYTKLLPLFAANSPPPPRDLPFAVYSYSGESALPEQVLSIRSFLRNAGCPKSFTVVSDGTYSERSINLLKRIHPSVSVIPSIVPPPDVPESFQRYLTAHPTGKQLALIMSLPAHDSPALYVDSDVRFFPQARALADLAQIKNVSAFYLADCQFAGDERLLRTTAEAEKPVNTGALLLFRKLDWSLGLARFQELTGPPSFFTNQTITHLVLHANGAQPFDPRLHVLQLDDQFVYRDRYAGSHIAFRHYVNPVRHKMWTSLSA